MTYKNKAIKAMDKALAVSIIILCLTGGVSADCGGPPDECEIEHVKTTHEFYRGDQIRIIVEFRNIGTETCCYRALLYNVVSAASLEWAPNLLWLRLEPGQSGTIVLSSGLSGWNACSLRDPAFINKGEALIDIIGVDRPPLPIECNIGWTNDPEGDSCWFTHGPTYIPPYLFTTPPDCCAQIQGVACMDYNQTYAGFTCDAEVQVNTNVPCLVECTYNELLFPPSCSCVLKEACALDCISGAPSYCLYDNFFCMGPHYRCANGLEPEVRCSNTVECKYQCAAACGKAAVCTSDCENCCDSVMWCNKIAMYPYGEVEKEVCKDACMGVCKANEELCLALYILEGVAAAIAALLIMFHGMKWMVSDDIEGRQDAKMGVVYVLIGLIMVSTATSLASYFLTGSLIPVC